MLVLTAVPVISARGDEGAGATNASSADVAPPASAPAAGAVAGTAPQTLSPIILTNAAPATFFDATPLPSLAPEPPLTNAPPAATAPVPPADSGNGFPSPYGPNDLGAHLLVVYNANDPDSKPLADYYANRRQIAPDHVFALNCPVTEEISRRDYDETIRSPIVTYLSVKDWLVREPKEVRVGERMLNLLMATRNDIWAIVLMRGVPLKIAGDPDDYFGMESDPQYQTNAAAVDSELALLPIFGLPLGGFVPNIFYEGQPNGIRTIGPDLACNVVLVTRLDGPTPADVHRLIDDTLSAEKHRLAGLAVIDSRGLTDEKSGYTIGDDWLRTARDMLVKDGWTVKFDDHPELLPATDPLDQVALYLGWYSQDAQGPWITPPARFVPGAVAYHLHSFSASTLRSDSSNWVGPLIAHGAGASMGTVYEPYLAFTPHEDIFTRHLLAGDYFAAAVYTAERGLSWMVTVVGDPLYRPFLVPLDSALSEANPAHHTPHDDWLFLQGVQRQIQHGQIVPSVQMLVDDLDVPGAGPVAYEGLADLLSNLNSPRAVPAAAREYAKAAAGDSAPIDRIRVGLKLAHLYDTHGQPDRSAAELANLRDLFPDDVARFGIPSAQLPVSGALSAPPPTAPKPVASPPAGLARLPQLPQLPKPTPSSP